MAAIREYSVPALAEVDPARNLTDLIFEHAAEQPNAVKLERFVFDAIPLAQNPIVYETERGEEFSPVKNAQGVDSPETSRRDQVRRAARWLATAGVEVPFDEAGEPAALLEPLDAAS